MITKIIEVTNGPHNWGKFMVCRFDSEWDYTSEVTPPLPLLRMLGWTSRHVWVLDLQTGEGGFFRPGGCAGADLAKHRIWVCPLYEPFLVWLYEQDLSDLDRLPGALDLPDAPFAFYGYRRPGEEDQ